MIQQCSSAGNNFSSFFLSNIPFGQTKPWRQPKMCWWDVQPSFPIMMRNQPDIFKIWLDTVQWLTVSSSTDVIKALHLCAFATGPISILICHSSHCFAGGQLSFDTTEKYRNKQNTQVNNKGYNLLNICMYLFSGCRAGYHSIRNLKSLP